MPKILLYTDTPQTGGAELQMFLLAKFLNKEKFTPILACSNYSSLDKWVENFDKEGIEVVRLKVSHKHDPRHLLQLKKVIKEKEIDILHAHVWNPASCRYAYMAAKSRKIELVTTEHDPFKLSFIKDLFKKRSLKTAKKVITVSEQNAKTLKDLYPQFSKKIKVIHNGIDTTWWQSQILRFTDKERKEIKEEVFHAKENTLIITTIAELHERKGLKYLINAIAILVEKFSNIKLVIIGEGKERDKLKLQIKKLKLEKNISLIGHQQKIPKLLKASDIFALPSRREAFGLVNAEAMISELPVVATKAGGIPEIVADGKTGLLVEPENAKDLAAALDKLISSESERQKLGQAGKERVLKHFDAKKMAEQYEKIYESLQKP